MFCRVVAAIFSIASCVKKAIHKADTRGHSQYDWLDSYHTFSFDEYFDSNRINFGALRVLLSCHRCRKDFRTTSGRYGKPQRTSAYTNGSKRAVGERRNKTSTNGCPIVEIYSRKRIIDFTKTACGTYNHSSIRNSRKPFFL